MNKTILIPTDFSIQSLTILKNILTNSTSKSKFNIVLLHGLYLGDSIRDLLFFSKSKQLESVITNEFEEALEVISNKFDSKISSLTIDLFTGYTHAAFNNYLESKAIEQIYISEYPFKKTNAKSFDLMPFIKKCGISTLSVDTGILEESFEKGKIADVFVNQISLG